MDWASTFVMNRHKNAKKRLWRQGDVFSKQPLD